MSRSVFILSICIFILTQGILVFYIGGTFIIGLLVPSNNPDLNLDSGTAASSPFVIAIQQAGIKALPSVCINLEEMPQD